MARFTRILCIDGGGVRALVPAQILVSLEAKLQRLTENPQTRLADHFDLVAGTSSGAILACFYLSPAQHTPGRARFTAQQAADLFLERASAIFRLSLWQRFRSLGGAADERYSAAGLEAATREQFGELRLSELRRPCLIPAYDIERRRAHFFKQREAQRSEERDFRVRDVLRAATAAPTYFEASRIRSLTAVPHALIDGGVFANNPSLAAFAEARNFETRPTAKDMLILSLGTGSVRKPYPHREARNWGLAEWLRPLIDIMMSGSSETVDYELARIYDSVGRGDQYLRVDTDLGEARPELDAAAPRNLTALRDLGQATAARYDRELEALARRLLTDPEPSFDDPGPPRD